MMLNLLFIIFGLALLTAGGEVLVAGASNFAKAFGIKPIIIGLTIVAFGTSMPEAFVSVLSAVDGKNDIALANVVGSNIFNILFILGLSALIRPLKVEHQSVRREIPFIIGSAFLTWILGADGILNRVDGIVLLLVFAVFLFVCIRTAGVNEIDEKNHPKKSGQKSIKDLCLIVLSLALLAAGAKLLLTGSVSVARNFGVSELFIGLTVVAAGTSLPELAASVIASIRGKDDIAVGNVAGSNIFNCTFILGLSAVIHPLSAGDLILNRDIVVMAAVSLLALPVLKSGFRVNRAEGLLLMMLYIGYTAYLIKSASA